MVRSRQIRQISTGRRYALFARRRFDRLAAATTASLESAAATPALSVVQHGGAACGAASETQACGTGPCPVHCDVSAWGAYDTCTRSCGGGEHTRARSVVTLANNGGYICPSLEETHACNAHACAIDCVQASWGAWDTCTASCNGGTQTRARSVTTPASPSTAMQSALRTVESRWAITSAVCRPVSARTVSYTHLTLPTSDLV